MTLQRTVRLLTALAVLATVGLLCLSLSTPEPDARPTSTMPMISSPVVSSPTISTPEQRLGFQGSLSCAATACHGSQHGMSDQADRDWFVSHAYTIWAANDPHAGAYRTLQSEQSRRIVAQLTGAQSESKEYDRKQYAATLEQHCFGCHAPAAPEKYDADSPLMLEGVACESCHGQAQRWLYSHLGTDFDPVADGMRPTEQLSQRAEACVDCHVGTGQPGKEVNHDLIAAGHPRLNFEFRAYHEALPKHWLPTEHDRNATGAWVQGQFVSARASLEQLQQRAKRNEIWPEFAEMDCYACHRALQFEAPTSIAPSGNNQLGSFRLQQWYLAGPRALEQRAGWGSLGEATQAPIEKLTSADTATVERAAQVTLERLDQLMKNSLPESDSRAGLQDLLQQLPYQQETWESHATAWLVASAIHAHAKVQLDRLTSANGDPQQVENLRAELAELTTLLRDYRQQLEPPAEFTPGEQFVTLTRAAEQLAATLQRLSSRP